MMSLVAYGSGSSSESEDEIQDTPTGKIQPVAQKLEKLNVGLQISSSIGPTVLGTGARSVPTTSNSLVSPSGNISSEEVFFNRPTSSTTSKSLLKSLPEPKLHTSSIGINEHQQLHSPMGTNLFASLPKPKRGVSDIESKSSTLSSNRRPGTKTVKIHVPALSQLKEDDAEPPKKKPKPTSKGSGLFALLPPPKNMTVKETKRALIPYTLTKKPSAPPVTSRQVPTIEKKPSLELISHGYPDSGEDSCEESETTHDFFSLNTNDDSSDLGESISFNSMDAITEDIGPQKEPTNNTSTDEPLAFVSDFQPAAWKYNQTSSGPAQQTNPKQSTSHEYSEEVDYLSVVEDDLQLDDEALQRLCGRRTKKQDMEFINVSGAELLPDPKEWLVKQLSQEQPTMRSHSHKKNDGPTSQQRRKHQITYLAFQAKENELELKNQWSQNRMTRKQTQSKYGF